MDLNRDNEDASKAVRERWAENEPKLVRLGLLTCNEADGRHLLDTENSRQWTRLSFYNVTPRGVDANANRTLSYVA